MAGIRINVGGQWRGSEAYIKVGTELKRADVYQIINGSWVKISSSFGSGNANIYATAVVDNVQVGVRRGYGAETVYGSALVHGRGKYQPIIKPIIGCTTIQAFLGGEPVFLNQSANVTTVKAGVDHLARYKLYDCGNSRIDVQNFSYGYLTLHEIADEPAPDVEFYASLDAKRNMMVCKLNDEDTKDLSGLYLGTFTVTDTEYNTSVASTSYFKFY